MSAQVWYRTVPESKKGKDRKGKLKKLIDSSVADPDLYHTERQAPDPDPHQSDKLDPDPDRGGKRNPNPDQFVDDKPKCMEYEPI